MGTQFSAVVSGTLEFQTCMYYPFFSYCCNLNIVLLRTYIKIPLFWSVEYPAMQSDSLKDVCCYDTPWVLLPLFVGTLWRTHVRNRNIIIHGTLAAMLLWHGPSHWEKIKSFLSATLFNASSFPRIFKYSKKWGLLLGIVNQTVRILYTRDKLPQTLSGKSQN